MQNSKGTTKKTETEFPQADTDQIHKMMNCLSICAACSKKCLEEGHKKTAAVCAECADVCALAIKSTCVESEFNEQIVDLCAQVCNRCTDQCKKTQIQSCQECAEVCRQCKDACSTAGHTMR
jgi:hypothetical protein